MSVSVFARIPEPPYYVVVFTSRRTSEDGGYAQMAERMLELARQQPGFLGFESVRDADGFGISVSYWTTEEAIASWAADAEHRGAQELGRQQWYASFELRVGRVERARAWTAPAPRPGTGD